MKQTQAQQKDYSEMLNFIFRIESEAEFADDIIQEYEDKYKVFVMETLADYVEENYNEEEQESAEESILMYYNGNNLVHWFLISTLVFN